MMLSTGHALNIDGGLTIQLQEDHGMKMHEVSLETMWKSAVLVFVLFQWRTSSSLLAGHTGMRQAEFKERQLAERNSKL